jgi:hypothetical protein
MSLLKKDNLNIKINIKLKDYCIRCVSNRSSNNNKLCIECYKDNPNESDDDFFFNYGFYTGFTHINDLYDMNLYDDIYYKIINSKKNKTEIANDLNTLNRKFYLKKNFFYKPISNDCIEDDNIDNNILGKYCTDCCKFNTKEDYINELYSQCNTCNLRKTKYNNNRLINAQNTINDEKTQICIKCYTSKDKTEFINKFNKHVQKCNKCRDQEKNYRNTKKL